MKAYQLVEKYGKDLIGKRIKTVEGAVLTVDKIESDIDEEVSFYADCFEIMVDDEVELVSDSENEIGAYHCSQITIEQAEDFYTWLQGYENDNFKLTPDQAFAVVYYLQEKLMVLPDHFEKCDYCDALYDTESEGLYSEKKEKNACGCCECEYFDEEDYYFESEEQ